ncbi:Zinc finger protein 239 [Portunus trituberculatus]|uniref:Zinc finger protein 239 n=1 Tax=Portunus trituberculatus TaxID=210409 RepID=A0A5B7ESH8_PORTR|nr:Zinc finger protein 239 [Portunus trituberculatus]
MDVHFQISGGSRSSTPAEPSGSRSLFPAVLRQDMRATGQASSAPHYPATSSPGSGLVTQGASLMALGPNVMFPAGRLMPGAAHDAHRYMTEAYRLAVGESEAQRMPYTAGGSSSQSLAGETHKSNSDISSDIGDRPQAAPQRQSHNERPTYITPDLPSHLNLDSPRLEGHSSRVLPSPERLSHNSNRITTTKIESDSIHFGKSMFTGSIDDSTPLSSQTPKSKGSSGPVAGSSHMFPVSFPSPYQQYSEEGAANFKRQYYDEAFTPRREALSDTSNTGGDSPQVNRGRSDSGEVAGAGSHLSRFENECPNQDIFCREDSSRGGSSPELGLLAQATEHSDLLMRSKGRKKKLEAIRPYVCEECGAKFTMMSNLKIHMRLHSGEKPFQCSSCDASFAQRSNLKTHEHIHNDERPFKCSECSAAFRQKTNLKTHKMKKHPVKSLKIKILCDSQYVMEDDMGDDDSGVSSQQMIGEPIVQIREGQGDQMPGLTGGPMEGAEMIKLEGDPYGRQGNAMACRAPNLLPQPCPSEANPYDSPSF